MKKMMKKAFAVAMLMTAGFVANGAYTTPAYAEVAATNVAVNVQVEQKNVINWEKGAQADVVAIGVGLPPTGMPAARAQALARRAAIVDAQRNLLETIKGVQIDSDTTVENLMVASDIVKTKVSGVLQGAIIIAEQPNPDGSYQVTMSVPMYGAKSLAAAAIPEVANTQAAPVAVEVVDIKATPLTKAEVKEVRQVRYTGVIVDAAGLGLEATFSPVIYDVNGRAVYGMKNIDPNFAISKGMVEYSKDLQKATVASRAGNNPLVVKATSVQGGKNSVNKVNVVVSVEDADKILLANENSQMLSQCAVVFVR